MTDRVAAIGRREPRFPGVDRAGRDGGGAVKAPKTDRIGAVACHGVEEILRCAAKTEAEVWGLSRSPTITREARLGKTSKTDRSAVRGQGGSGEGQRATTVVGRKRASLAMPSTTTSKDSIRSGDRKSVV